MNNGYIALIDSGIGGISLLLELIKLLPNERFLYFGDNKNAPYGNKNKRQLLDLTLSNIDYIKRYNVKVLVVACNTLSANFLEEIRVYSNLPTFGVFPPVEKAITMGGKTLLLATNLTSEKYRSYRNIEVVGLNDLANKIESNIFSIDNLTICDMFRQSGLIDKKSYYDTIILGCTHYFFVKNKIFDHFRPRKILMGETFASLRVKKYLESQKSLGKHYINSVLFIGENAIINERFYNLCGQKDINFYKKN